LLDISKEPIYSNVVKKENQLPKKLFCRASKRQRFCPAFFVQAPCSFWACFISVPSGSLISTGGSIRAVSGRGWSSLSDVRFYYIRTGVCQGQVFHAFSIQPAAGLLLSIFVIAVFLAFIAAVFGVYFSFLKSFMIRLRQNILSLHCWLS